MVLWRLVVLGGVWLLLVALGCCWLIWLLSRWPLVAFGCGGFEVFVAIGCCW